MTTVWKWIINTIAALGAWLAYLLGGWDSALGIMFTIMALDFITGILVALLGKSDKTTNGNFKSSVAFIGITKKLLMVIIVMLATALDRILGTDGICRIAVIGFYSANDGMSIIENVSMLGVPIPKGLLDILMKIREKNDGPVLDDKNDETE